jgi:orotate phosphoribosyltransferase
MDKDLRKIFIRYLREHRGGRPMGRQGEVYLTMFLDLLSAVHESAALDILSSLLAEAISADPESVNCEAMVGPKTGNCLLVKGVASRLKMKTSFVRDSILFGTWVEGPVRAGQKVLLVDDIGSDPEMLCEAVGNLRREGVYVIKVWVLVHRREFDVKERLAELGTAYSALCDIGDDDLRALWDER